MLRYTGTMLTMLMAVGLGACGTDLAEPTSSTAGPPESLDPRSGAATRNELLICSWSLGDFTGPIAYLNSGMNEDGSYWINQYYGEDFYYESRPVTGLTTVYGDSLVTIKGNLPANSYTFAAEAVETTAVTLQLDLRLRIGHSHPGARAERGLTLVGTIDGVAVASGDLLRDKPATGRALIGGSTRTTPFYWYGANGYAEFCRR